MGQNGLSESGGQEGSAVLLILNMGRDLTINGPKGSEACHGPKGAEACQRIRCTEEYVQRGQSVH